MKRIRFSWRYALILVGLAAAVFMVVDFNNRLTELRGLTVQKQDAEARLVQLTATQGALRTAIAYATSPAAVEKWAYEEGHMARPGDNPVVPVAPEGASATPTPIPQPRPTPAPTWQLWRWLFFGP